MQQLTSLPSIQTTSWQQQLAQTINDPRELLSRLNLSMDDLAGVIDASKLFPIKITQRYLEKIPAATPDDPLLMQVLGQAQELIEDPHYSDDPVSELDKVTVPGVIHKYHGRVLIVATGACAIHCRYCFRRHFPYQGNAPSRNQWRDMLHYIESDQTISEVILSGGDPLVLSDEKLTSLFKSLEAIDHLKRVRIHTRLPVVLPDRITPEFIHLLETTRLSSCVVIHANHANEISLPESQALGALSRVTQLLNQSVLLRGVNNHGPTLAKLSETLYECGVMPYYLHLLDKVAGAAHFEVDESEANAIMDYLQARLPGYLVPKLVRDVAGKEAKVSVR